MTLVNSKDVIQAALANITNHLQAMIIDGMEDNQ